MAQAEKGQRGEEGIGEKKTHKKREKKSKCALFSPLLLLLLLLMLIPNGGLGKVFSLLCVRLSSVLYFVFLLCYCFPFA